MYKMSKIARVWWLRRQASQSVEKIGGSKKWGGGMLKPYKKRFTGSLILNATRCLEGVVKRIL